MADGAQTSAAATARNRAAAEAAVVVSGLKKSYGPVRAVDDISFQIQPGEVFGLLGPNGAGKTSTVEVLAGLRPADAGYVRVCGLDPHRDGRRLQERIGPQLQATMLPDKLRVEEALRLFAGFYGRVLPVAGLLDRFGLTEKRRTYFQRLSGGQKQRLALALALVNDPELVLLDEPTTGLDPRVRREVHGLIAGLRAERRTVLLTTHYIEEAERLCDRVAVMHRGHIVAIGPPRQVVAAAGLASEMEIRLAQPADCGTLATLDAVAAAYLAEGDGGGAVYRLRADAVAPAVVALVRWLDQTGNRLLDLQLRQPTLEDAFVRMTGPDEADRGEEGRG
jgi:ABC-2 type transport system ATP-binding protein